MTTGINRRAHLRTLSRSNVKLELEVSKSCSNASIFANNDVSLELPLLSVTLFTGEDELFAPTKAAFKSDTVFSSSASRA